MEKPALLFIAHRIPYPPNKGDKIRSFNMLRQLARHYRIYLGAFIDDSDDWQYQENLHHYCEEVLLIDLGLKQKLLSLRGLLTGEALSIPYYRRSAMQRWVDNTIDHHSIERVFVFSSAMAQFISGKQYHDLHRVIDFVDVDSEKWRAYSHSTSWPMSWLYRREARCLFDFDREIATEFDASFFVSEHEAQLFTEISGSSDKIHFIYNGVDADYFSPDHKLDNPYPPTAKVLVFTGAMDYWANVDAVCWFADDVLPIIQKALPQILFYIVGGKPSGKVLELGNRPGITVTGRVDDMRPWLKYAQVAVAPMRIARGIQNKVLEALAMEVPVVATEQAMEGIGVFKGTYTCNDAQQFAHECIELLKKQGPIHSDHSGRAEILEHYNWQQNLKKIECLLERAHCD